MTTAVKESAVLAELRKLAHRVSLLETGKRQTKRMPVQMLDVHRFVSNGKRVVRGIATMPGVDRMGDIVDPLGGQWKLPLPLLWQHKHDQPIGWVREATASRAGVRIVAEIAEGIAVADQAWSMIDKGLVDSFSIGFRALDWEPISTGKRFTKWELHEISVVTIPALPSAKITATKAAHGGVKLIDMRGSVRLLPAGGRRG
ncbi:HK97 family phage prohead protease [Luteimonas sp. R10]|uniref:HK97 family phage prohead protease n=1 Tax=Luteimonas sp. R10 TaxID=3108176 RepID=UPI00308859A0|nr:HK97 family phage prohead protease [Luteimonas sp. R10]